MLINCLKTEKKVKKPKGLKKNVVRKEILFEDFRKCLLTRESDYKKQNVFKTEKHNVYRVELNKKALSACDDKRFVLDNGINTLAWGHYKMNIKNENVLNYLK